MRMAAIAVAVFALSAPSAYGHESPEHQTMVAIALAIFPEAAERCPSVTIDSTHEATSPFGPEIQMAAWTWPENCVLVFGPWGLFHDLGGPGRKWALVAECGTLVHEYGHLAAGNHEHSQDPNSIMYELGPQRPIPACKAAFLPTRTNRAHKRSRPGQR